MDQVIKAPQLYDKAGSPIDLPEDKIPDALASGQYSTIKGTRIPVVDQEGKPFTVPAAQAKDAFDLGYQYEPESAQTDRIKSAAYDTPQAAALAAMAGVGRGATLGLSDVALTKTGLATPGLLADLQKYRPNWSMAGEGAGIIGGSFIDPGLGPLSLVGKAGKAVTSVADRAALDALGATAERIGLGGNATVAKVLAGAADVGAHAAGSAVEGALYSGIGNSVTEAALGDPDLNAEKIMANFGYGALYGGALGGVLKGAEIGIPASLQAAKEGAAALRNTLIGTGVEDAGLVGDVFPGKISDALANRSMMMDDPAKTTFIGRVTDNLNEFVNNIGTTIKKLNQEIRPEETDALIDTADPAKVRSARFSVIQEMNEAINKMRGEPELFSPAAARKLELQRNSLMAGVDEDLSPLRVFNDLRQTKQELQKIVFSKIPTSQEMESIKVLDGIQKSLNSTLHNPDVFGFAGSSLAAHDEMLSQYYKFMAAGKKLTPFQKAFGDLTGSGPNARWQFSPQKVERIFRTQEGVNGAQKMGLLNQFYDLIKGLPEHLENTYANVPNERFDGEHLSRIIENSKASNFDAAKKYIETLKAQKGSRRPGLAEYAALGFGLNHPLIGAAIEAYNIATKPIESMNKLAEVERIVGKATNFIGKGAKLVFDPAVKGLTFGKNAIVKLSTEARSDRHNEMAKQFAEFKQDPQSLIDKVAENTDRLHSGAPNTAGALQQTMAKGAQFLATKMPGGGQSSPLSEPYEPSSAELATFDRYHSIVEDPMKAFEQVRDGTLVPQTIETLNAVYPKLYAEMRTSLLSEMSSKIQKKEKIPFQLKQGIAQFLGQPIDHAMNPQAILANQMSIAMAPKPQGLMAPQKTRAKGLDKMDRSGRATADYGAMSENV